MLNLFVKNIKLLVRSRSSAAVVLAAPIAVVLLLAVLLSQQSAQNISVAVYTPQTSDDTQQLIESLSDQFTLQVVQSEELCISSVKTGQFDACAVFSDPFILGQGSAKTLTIYNNEAKIHAASVVSLEFERSITETNKQIGSNLTQAYFGQIQQIQEQLSNNATDSVNRTLSLLADVQVNIGSVQDDIGSIDTFREEITQEEIDKKRNEAFSNYREVLSLFRDALNDFEYAFEQLESIAATSPEVVQISQKNLEDIAFLKNETNRLQTSNETTTVLQLELVLNQLIDNKNDLATKLNLIEEKQLDLGSSTSTIDASLSDIKTNIETIGQNIQDSTKLLTQQSATETDTLIEPILLSQQSVGQDNTRFLHLIPIILALTTMISSIMLAATFIAQEKSSAALFRNFLAPVSNAEYIASMILTISAIVFAQVGLILVGTAIFFPQTLGVIYAPLVTILLSSVIFASIGMLVGYLFNSQYNIVIGAVLTCIVMAAASDIFLPMQWLPVNIRDLIQYTPFSLMLDILRESILYGIGVNITKIGILAALSVVCFVLVLSALKSFKLLTMLYMNRLGKTYK